MVKGPWTSAQVPRPRNIGENCRAFLKFLKILKNFKKWGSVCPTPQGSSFGLKAKLEPWREYPDPSREVSCFWDRVASIFPAERAFLVPFGVKFRGETSLDDLKSPRGESFAR